MPETKYAGEVVRSFDSAWSQQYRQFDNRSADAAFAHYGDVIGRLSASFGKHIDVLDVGCGTGRYFHRLCNVSRLVGVDLSPHMLEQARTPVHADQVKVGSVQLLCGEAGRELLPDQTFDLIYSVGVLGEYSPLDKARIAALKSMLKSQGILFVTAVDALSRVSIPEKDQPSLVRKVVRKSFPYLPGPARLMLNRTLSPWYVSRRQLDERFAASGFSRHEIKEYVHEQGWSGTHFDCYGYT